MMPWRIVLEVPSVLTSRVDSAVCPSVLHWHVNAIASSESGSNNTICRVSEGHRENPPNITEYVSSSEFHRLESPLNEVHSGKQSNAVPTSPRSSEYASYSGPFESKPDQGVLRGTNQ